MEKIEKLLVGNPHYFGVLFALIGIVMLLAAIFDSDWLFGSGVNRGTYDIRQVDGLVNFFGRKTARIVVGITSLMVVFGGILWFWIYAYYYKK